jgi:hypothetical protein
MPLVVRSLGDIPARLLVHGARFAVPAGSGWYEVYEYRSEDVGIGLSGIGSFFAKIGGVRQIV